jgi:hypothetical protein
MTSNELERIATSAYQITELFWTASDQPVCYRGQELHRKLEFHLAPGQVVVIEFEKYRRWPEQSLEVFASKKKSLQIFEDRGDMFTLIARKWKGACRATDISRNGTIKVTVINAWQTSFGKYVNIGNASMLIEQLGANEWRLKCSHHRDRGPKFDSLVARVKIEPLAET